MHRLKKVNRDVRRNWKRYWDSSAEFGAYKRWLKSHPDGNFKSFYVYTIERHLVGEGRHSTLGPRPNWKKQGEETLQQLITLGLTTSDLVVDYGCGTLREGVHFIRYLDPGRYVGLDIDERILNAGRLFLGQNLVNEKQPHLAIVNPSVIAQVAAANPAWIISSYVVSQMPPADLDEYFNNLAKLAEGGGKVSLQVRLAWRTKQYSKTGWYHNQSRLLRRLADRRFKVLQLRTHPLTSKPYKVQGVNARLIVCRIGVQ